jgi:hypothetical protein
VNAVEATAAPQLGLTVSDVSAVAEAVVPTLRFRLRVDAAGREVRALALNVQVRIDAARRRYEAADERRLLELFGRRERWGETLRSLMWATISTNVPAFTGATSVDLHMPATYDFEVVAAKYLNALEGGDVPLELLFSGSIFHTAPGGGLRVAPLSCDQDLRTVLPVDVWRAAVENAFPGSAWLRLSREGFDRLWAFRATRALPSWDATLDELLDGRE